MFNKFKSDKTKYDTNLEEELLSEVSELPTNSTTDVLPKKIISNAQKSSIISEGASFEGSLSFEGALHLDGKFKGNIKVDKITVGKNGALDGKLEANTIVAFGEIKGDISCKELTLNAGSNLDGIIQYANIKVHPGASIAGQINCKK